MITQGGSIPLRLEQVRDRIAEAARRAGRTPDRITLIGVSKTISTAHVQEAVEAGLADLGENRVQEAEEKIPQVRPGPAGLTWHLVGHLQRNKARKAVALFSWIHSVDTAELALRLDRLAAEAGRRLDVLVEVNVADETTKQGIHPARLGQVLETLASLENLRVAGLMAVPPILPEGSPAAASRPHFRRLAALRDSWRSRGYDLPALSMGMSDDFEVAVEEGATHVRVGRAIFGERPPAGAAAG